MKIVKMPRKEPSLPRRDTKKVGEFVRQRNHSIASMDDAMGALGLSVAVLVLVSAFVLVCLYVGRPVASLVAALLLVAAVIYVSRQAILVAKSWGEVGGKI